MRLWPVTRVMTPEALQQVFIDGLVQATLERSGLIQSAEPLRKQKRGRKREEMVNTLFLIVTMEAEDNA